MDINYHINLVKKPTTGYNRTNNDHELARHAQTLYPAVAQAMLDAVVDGDWEKYCCDIKIYDQFVWEQSHKGDKSNIFAYKKIKISPSWTEQLWAPVFERVRRSLQNKWNTGLILIQNTEVVESWSTGPASFKDVDGGIGILDATYGCVMPIVVVEDKTGHFCKTACTGVDGIMRRVRTMNPNVLGMCITDNQVSVGQDSLVENVFGAGGVLISQRGTNGSKERYPKLNSEKFKLVEDLCLNYLDSKTKEDFLIKTSTSSSNVFLREQIDRNGVYIPPDLKKYL
jgi:hypothetical protein